MNKLENVLSIEDLEKLNDINNKIAASTENILTINREIAVLPHIEKTIILINENKQHAIDEYNLTESNEPDLDIHEYSLHVNLCEHHMDLCAALLEKLQVYTDIIGIEDDNLDDYLLENFNFEMFDATLIFNYFNK